MVDSEYVDAIILGVVQGIAEFLPISSKGHLVVAGKLLERLGGKPLESPGGSLLMIIALHVGTLGSLLVVYRHDLRALLRDFRLCLAIVLATIPVAVIGMKFKDDLEAMFDEPLAAACGWLVTAALLWTSERFGKNEKPLEQMTLRDALTVGMFQIVALLPGISRSGSTMAGGLCTGMTRAAAAKFSFLIAIPAVAGVAVVKGGKFARDALTGTAGYSAADFGPMAVGALVSFVIGVLALQWLLKVVVRRGLGWFAWYCVCAAVLTFLWQAFDRAELPAESVVRRVEPAHKAGVFRLRPDGVSASLDARTFWEALPGRSNLRTSHPMATPIDRLCTSARQAARTPARLHFEESCGILRVRRHAGRAAVERKLFFV